MSTDSTTAGTLHAGWDFFTGEPDRHAVMHCRVCGEPMAVDRDVVGPTGWAHAMAIRAGHAKGRLHDEFHCERAGEPWHRQALALRQEAEQTPSKRLAELLTAEADEVVRTRTATKGVMG
jgi:hypothetical protein